MTRAINFDEQIKSTIDFLGLLGVNVKDEKLETLKNWLSLQFERVDSNSYYQGRIDKAEEIIESMKKEANSDE